MGRAKGQVCRCGRSKLDLWTARVRFVVGEVALGQGCLRASVSFHPTKDPNTLIREVDNRLLTVNSQPALLKLRLFNRSQKNIMKYK